MTDPDLRQIEGLWWPGQIGGGYKRYLGHRKDTDAAIKRCRQRRIAVQAGGHVGIFPLRLAEKFEHVFTFEPHPINWVCLDRNTAGNERIKAFRAGLGETGGRSRLKHNPKNSGGSKINVREGTVDIEMMTVDELALPACDFLCLDIEGYELAALKGAAQTVARFRPVVQVEFWNHERRHGWTEQDVRRWLKGWGYAEVARVGHDHVFVAG